MKRDLVLVLCVYLCNLHQGTLSMKRAKQTRGELKFQRLITNIYSRNILSARKIFLGEIFGAPESLVQIQRLREDVTGSG